MATPKAKAFTSQQFLKLGLETARFDNWHRYKKHSQDARFSKHYGVNQQTAASTWQSLRDLPIDNQNQLIQRPSQFTYSLPFASWGSITQKMTLAISSASNLTKRLANGRESTWTKLLLFCKIWWGHYISRFIHEIPDVTHTASQDSSFLHSCIDIFKFGFLFFKDCYGIHLLDLFFIYRYVLLEFI